jgi:hypothetical protein
MGRRKGIWTRGKQKEEDTGLPHHDWTVKRETLWLAPSIVQERRDTLIRIFHIFDSEAISTLQIARKLNDGGISPVLADKWDHSKIWGLLQNPAVIGRPSANKVTSAKLHMVSGGKQVRRGQDDIGRFIRHAKGDWLMPDEPIFDPLISEELFWRCAMKIHQQTPVHGHHETSTYCSQESSTAGLVGRGWRGSTRPRPAAVSVCPASTITTVVRPI